MIIVYIRLKFLYFLVFMYLKEVIQKFLGQSLVSFWGKGLLNVNFQSECYILKVCFFVLQVQKFFILQVYIQLGIIYIKKD